MIAGGGAAKGFLPEDLIDDILVRLPARSLGRFRSVCKRWRSLTSDPKFVLAHASRAPISGFFRPGGGHIYLDNRPYSLHSRPRPPDCSFFKVQSSSCGLVLFDQMISGSRSYLLYNPVTMQSWPTIPHPENIRLYSAALAFDPSRSPDFKIVGFRRDSECLFYSSRTRNWNLSPTVIFLSTHAYCNGRILWVSLDSRDPCLVSFDVESESLGRVEQPPAQRDCLYLGASGGSLHFTGRPDSLILRFDIWELMPDFSVWSPLLSVSVPDAVSDYLGPLGVFYFHRGGAGQADQLFLSARGKVFSYNLQDKPSIILRDNYLNVIYRRPKVILHAETLISP